MKNSFIGLGLMVVPAVGLPKADTFSGARSTVGDHGIGLLECGVHARIRDLFRREISCEI
jgi:hypothetical protein